MLHIIGRKKIKAHYICYSCHDNGMNSQNFAVTPRIVQVKRFTFINGSAQNDWILYAPHYSTYWMFLSNSLLTIAAKPCWV